MSAARIVQETWAGPVILWPDVSTVSGARRMRMAGVMQGEADAVARNAWSACIPAWCGSSAGRHAVPVTGITTG